MTSTIAAELIDRAKTSIKIESDYAFARVMHTSPNQIYRWRSGRKPLSEDRVLELCELARECPTYWLAANAAERAGSDKLARAWHDAAEEIYLLKSAG